MSTGSASFRCSASTWLRRSPWLARSRPFPDFDDFVQALRDYVLPITGTPEWIERHAFEVTEDLARQAVRYAEIIVSHDFHMRRGLDHAAVGGDRRRPRSGDGALPDRRPPLSGDQPLPRT